MESDAQTIKRNLSAIRTRIRMACERSGRDPGDVTLVGVSKFKPVESLCAAARAGLTDFGENYAQELLAKAPILASENLAIRWHFIGGLQSNKARKVVPIVTSVQSVDRPSLVAELSRAATLTRPLDVFIEVNLAGEAQKSGAEPKDVKSLAGLILAAPGLRLAGLMTVPPIVDDPEQSRPFFRTLRALRDNLRSTLDLQSEMLTGLSMGMSYDFEVAIEEGATMVRVGTAIFGSRG